MANAQITKRLCIPVGSYEQNGQTKTEYRDVGLEIEFTKEDGSRWSELKIHADMLNPVLFNLARRGMDPGASTVRVKKFDVGRKEPAAGNGPGAPAGGSDWDDAPPF